MHQEDTIANLATTDHDVEANARERHTRLADARWEIRRQHAAEAVCRVRTRRHGVAVVMQHPVGDDVSEVAFADVVEERTVA